jgi:hypothetical protein
MRVVGLPIHIPALRDSQQRRGRICTRGRRHFGPFSLVSFFLFGCLRADREGRRVALLRQCRRRQGGLGIVRGDGDVLFGFDEDVWGVVFCVMVFVAMLESVAGV